LWPVDPLLEQNWSGRGQHAEFKKNEQNIIDQLLEVQETLGTTRSAFVQSVKCRRILLARKTVRCGKTTLTKEEAVSEVSHLTRLNHAHILRVIGTYVKGRELSILLYPVADCNLEDFLELYRDMCLSYRDLPGMETFLRRCCSCLSSAVEYIHRNLTKHMDINPQNILVLRTRHAVYVPFIADFGIARSYDKVEETETDGRTSFTKRYAAPEVVKQESRGLPADIFSLECVFIEVYNTLSIKGLQDTRGFGLQSWLNANSDGDPSYQANISALQAHLLELAEIIRRLDPPASLIIEMLRYNPKERPSAEKVLNTFGYSSCCIDGAIALHALKVSQTETESSESDTFMG
jgi:serine/threonine protein kinase